MRSIHFADKSGPSSAEMEFQNLRSQKRIRIQKEQPQSRTKERVAGPSALSQRCLPQCAFGGMSSATPSPPPGREKWVQSTPGPSPIFLRSILLTSDLRLTGW